MDRIEHMVQLFETGKTLQEIGDKFRISKQRVSQLLHRCGYNREDGGRAVRSAIKQKEFANTREANYLRKYGFGLDAMMELKHSGTYWKYVKQKKNASARGIEWHLTFAEWWNAWLESGHWDERGIANGYCMARKGDVGPYALENIYFCTIGQNFSDSYIFKPYSVRKKRLAKPAIQA